MKCPNCQDDVYETDDVCMSCGYDLTPPVEQRAPATPPDGEDKRITPGAVVWKLVATLATVLVSVLLWFDPTLSILEKLVERWVGRSVIEAVHIIAAILALYLIVQQFLWPRILRLVRDPRDNIIEAVEESSVRIPETKHTRERKGMESGGHEKSPRQL